MKNLFKYLFLTMMGIAVVAVPHPMFAAAEAPPATAATAVTAAQEETKEGAEGSTGLKARIVSAIAGMLTREKQQFDTNVARLELREKDSGEQKELLGKLELVLERLIKPLLDVLEISKDRAARRNLRKIIEKGLEESLGKGIWANPDTIEYAINDINRPLKEGVFAELLRLLQANKMTDAVILTRTAYGGSSAYGRDFKIADFNNKSKGLLARLIYMGLYGSGRPFAFMFDEMDSSQILMQAQEKRQETETVLQDWDAAVRASLHDMY